MEQGTLYGVGLGPGDPDLISVKADRLIRNAKNIAYFRKKGTKGRARQIVDKMIMPNATEMPMDYPVTTEIHAKTLPYKTLLQDFYTQWAEKLRVLCKNGHDVVVLCEGEPFFYGSFMHLHARLHKTIPIETIPGITGMSAAWTATNQPIAWGDAVFTTLMGTLSQATLEHQLAHSDAVIIMKIGRHLPKIRDALINTHMIDRAWLVQFASMPEQKIYKLRNFTQETTPYFSIIVIHSHHTGTRL